MDKMNQVSVTEFMSKSKEEMYDMAVEMVEKYNRLVDICNDSAERMADLIERHKVYTNALNKDIVDKGSKIDLLEKEIEGRKEGYYALKDKMTDLEETLEIRTKENRSLIKANEKLEKESEKWQDLAKMNRDTICDQYGVCEDFKDKIAELEKELADCKVKIKHQKENLDGINKTLEIRTKENERLIAVKNNQDREIEAHEAENARLSEKIVELKRQNEYLTEELNDSYKAWNTDSKNHRKRDMTLVDEIAKKNKEIEKLKVDLIHEREKNEKLARAHAELENDMRKLREEQKTLVDICDKYKKENGDYAVRVNKLKKELDRVYGITFASASIREEDDHGRTGFKKYIEWLIEEEERAVPERFKARLNEEITEIFTKEEETEVRCRKPDGYYCSFSDECCRKPENFNCDFKDDIPCGSDSIE